MNLADVARETATRLRALGLLNVHDHPIRTVTPPAAILTYPDDITFDETYGRGSDRIAGGLWVAVGAADSQSARDELAELTAGDGPRSVKAWLEAGEYASFDTIAVPSVRFDPVTIGSNTYMGALFTLDIQGPGSGS